MPPKKKQVKIRDAGDILIRGEDLGDVRPEGKATVKALAKAFEKLGRPQEEEEEVEVRDENVSPPKKKDEDDGDVDLDVDLGEDLDVDLDLADEEFGDDVQNEPAKEETLAIALDDEELDLDVDLDVDLDEEDAAPAAKPGGGAQPMDMSAFADDEEIELDDEEIDLDDTQTTEEKKAPPPPQPTSAAPSKSAPVAPTAAAPPATNAPIIQVSSTGSKILVPSHALPNNRFLKEPFRVFKVDEGALVGAQKERIWEMDFFSHTFCNLDMNGNITFSQPAKKLYRIEKHFRNTRRLVLYFTDAPHPYDLVFTSTERRQRFYEVALTQRAGAILWCPSLCPDNVNDAEIEVQGTTIERHNGRTLKVKGDGHFSVARMPYEVVDVWFGCLSLMNHPLPQHPETLLQQFIPKDTHEVYVVGLCDVPAALIGNGQVGDYLREYLGKTYFVVASTGPAGRPRQKRANNVLVVLARKSFILRLSNLEAVEMDVKSAGAEKGDFSACAACFRVNESTMGFMLLNSTPVTMDPRQRSTFIRGVIGNFPLGDNSVDVSVRFDYFVAGGAFGFAHTFTDSDELVSEAKRGNFMVDFQEAKAGPGLSSRATSSPMRILYWARPRNCRLDIKTYDCSTAINLNNANVSMDVFAQRAFLSSFGEYSAPCHIFLNAISIDSGRMPPIQDAELHMLADWIEISPSTVPIKKLDGKAATYVTVDNAMPPLKPISSIFDYLRLQHLNFSIVGTISAQGQKAMKGVIASGTLPLKNILVAGETKEFDIPLVYRTVVVSHLRAKIQQVTVGQSKIAALSSAVAPK